MSAVTGDTAPTPLSRRERWTPLAVLAAAIYTPLVFTAPGRVGADTKSYLYLDPARLLSRAWSMWDPSIGLGTVSHQNIGYLWPMGPWFWAFERLGVPDWVAQRLWLGTILVAAGAGTLWLLRSVLGWRTAPATVAAFAYALTPYSLTLAARISVILLPFAGLPWMIGLVALALRRGGWRYPAAFALVIATVGSVNATALALAGLGPVLWLLHARLSGEATTRTVVSTIARIGALTVVANLWWLVGLWVQGGYGIEILRYTETAEVVASASNGVEVLRGLGYWFFYGGDRIGPWIEPGTAYTQRLPLLALTFAIPTVALAALARTRFRHRAFFVGLVVIGTIAAVGAHPWDSPPIGAAGIKAFLLSGLGLAMRSLPRAAPLVALGLAAALGAGVGALAEAERWPRLRRNAGMVALATGVAAYVALPPLWTGGLVAGNLDRPTELPAYWDDAIARIDAGGTTTRVLEVPGVDFATYRWGNTVDPITPGLTDRPYVARELIPYGSPASTDLLNALDRRFQERTLDPGALAVVARLMGVGDVVLRDDLQFERHRTPRPYVIAPQLDDEPGLGAAEGFGAPVVNQPVPAVPLLDDLALLADDGDPRPPVAIYPVDDARPIVRAAPAGGGVVLAGDGEGLVDAASAGLLGGDELVRYGASLGSAGVDAALDDGALLVVTDGNRRQGRRWSTVRDTLGYVEGVPVLEEDLTDNRLPIFEGAEDGWETTSRLASGASATATSYGNPISFTPEFRPTNAVDGDLDTEWRTGASADVRGERLLVAGVSGRHLLVVQQQSGFRNRHIAEIGVRVDGSADQHSVVLDDASLTPEGQLIDLQDVAGAAATTSVELEVLADSSGREGQWGRPVRFGGLSQIGFAEVQLLDDDTDPERVTGPEQLVLPPAAMQALGADTPVALVLTRWRTDPSEAVRADPEPALARSFDLPVGRTFSLAGVAAVSSRAGDAVLDALVSSAGPVVESSSRLAGAVDERGSAALDGDPSTWWSPAFGEPEPSLTVTATGGAPLTFDRLDPLFVEDGRRSVPTLVRIEADGVPVATVDLATPRDGPVVLDAPVTATTFRFVVEALAERTTIEWFSSTIQVVPPAIAELGIPGLAVTRPAFAGTPCRDDLVQVDGEPLPVQVGADLTIAACAGDVVLAAGEHTITSTAGRETGIDINRLVLRSGLPPTGPERDAPTVTVTGEGRASVDLRVDGATPGEPFWLVLGQSQNLGWEATGPGVPTGESTLVDGYANGWLVTPQSDSFTVSMTWGPQRAVTSALLLSAVAVLGCIALLVVTTFRRSAIEGSYGDDESSAAPGSRSVGPATAIAAITIGTVLFVGPVAAAVVAAVGLVVWARPGLSRWLRWAPPITYALAAGYVVLRQAVSKPSAAFEWPAEQATAHQPALTAVALLVVILAVDAARTRRAAATPEPERRLPDLPTGVDTIG